MDLVNRLGGINHADFLGLAAGFGEKALSHLAMVGAISVFDSVSRTPAPHERDFHGQIENKSQIRLQATRGQSPDFPKLAHFQPTCVPLINDIG